MDAMLAALFIAIVFIKAKLIEEIVAALATLSGELVFLVFLPIFEFYIENRVADIRTRELQDHIARTNELLAHNTELLVLVRAEQFRAQNEAQQLATEVQIQAQEQNQE